MIDKCFDPQEWLKVTEHVEDSHKHNVHQVNKDYLNTITEERGYIGDIKILTEFNFNE